MAASKNAGVPAPRQNYSVQENGSYRHPRGAQAYPLARSVVVHIVPGSGASVACQHCGFEADGRVFCPQCRRKMRPADRPEPVTTPLNLAEQYARQREVFVPMTPADACATCRRSPGRSARYYTVRSYVLFFRWRSTELRLCRDCGRDAFRDAQYECLTRGWWGLLVGPLATIVALARNIASWWRLRSLPEPEGQPSVPSERPLHRRPVAYLTTVLAATLAAIALLSPQLGESSSNATLPLTLSQLQPTPAPPAPLTDPTPSGQQWTGPLTRLAISAPAGWRRERDLSLSVASLSKLFKHPSQAKVDLAALNYQHGIDRAFFRPSPRVVIEEQLWQFDTTDDANGWFLFWLASNRPAAGSTYKTGYTLNASTNSSGLIARARDQYGFSYGVAIAQIGNVIIHVRYSSLSTVTRADLNLWLTKAVNIAQPRMSG